MTINTAIELIEERRKVLLNLISQINEYDNENRDELDKRILHHEMEIAKKWKQDLEDILEELISE